MYVLTFIPCRFIDLLFQSIDLENIKGIVPSWKNVPYPGEIPNGVAREILDEIFRASFKAELLLADRFLFHIKLRRSADDEAEAGEVERDDLCANSRGERNIRVIAALFVEGDPLAFASRDPSTRQRTLHAFFRVMHGWSKMPQINPQTVADAQRLVGDQFSKEELDKIEYHLAYHYIATFADFFKRAPILPHR